MKGAIEVANVKSERRESTFRITTRGVMLLIAVLAILFTVSGFVYNSKQIRKRLDYIASQERAYFQESGNDYQLAYDSVRSGGPGAVKEGQEYALKADWERRVALHYGSLRQKYETARWKPWATLPLDPPPPDYESPLSPATQR